MMRRMWKCARILLCLLMAGSPAQAQYENAARHIFDLTNQDRQARGLPPLEWNAALARAAERHAALMARQGSISHQYAGEPAPMERAAQAGAHFHAVAENVAMAPTASDVETSWMHSTPHRRNILDPQMNAMGVGVATRNGELYAVEDFAAASQTLNAGDVEQRVRAMLRDDGLDPTLAPGGARQACSMEQGMPQGTNARLMIRMQAPDLQQIQSQIERQIDGRHYTRAAVGACRQIGQGNFTLYRVAVLLY